MTEISVVAARSQAAFAIAWWSRWELHPDLRYLSTPLVPTTGRRAANPNRCTTTSLAEGSLCTTDPSRPRGTCTPCLGFMRPLHIVYVLSDVLLVDPVGVAPTTACLQGSLAPTVHASPNFSIRAVSCRPVEVHTANPSGSPTPRNGLRQVVTRRTASPAKSSAAEVDLPGVAPGPLPCDGSALLLELQAHDLNPRVEVTQARAADPPAGRCSAPWNSGP